MTKQKVKPAAKPSKKAPETKSVVAEAPASFVLKSVTPSGATGRLQNVRLAWVKVAKPQVDKQNPLKASLSVVALIHESDFKEVSAQVFAAVKQMVPLSKKIVEKADRIEAFNKALKTGEKGALFKKGEQSKDKAKKIYDGFAGHYTLQVKTTLYRKSLDEEFSMRIPLALYDKKGNAVLSGFIEREFYSGCIAHVACTFATYDFQGSKGVTCYLNGLMKVGDGERMGASNPFSDVEPLDDESGAGVYSGEDDLDAF